MLYRFIITRGGAKLVALVAIKNNFPEEKSVFSVTVHWNGTHHSGNCDTLRVGHFKTVKKLKFANYHIFL